MATFSKSKTLKSSPVSPNLSRRSTGHLPLTTSIARPKSGSGRRLAASLDAGNKKSFDVTNWDVSKVESEYIKNLQQQVTEEAERMMRKLKLLQGEVDSRSQDVMRKESQIMIMMNEKEEAIRKLRDCEESFAQEKKELVDEIVRYKKQSERLQQDNTRREIRVSELKNDHERGITALDEAEDKLGYYRRELDAKTEQYNRLRVEFEEKRAECLKIQTEFQELEERFFKSGVKSKEEVGRDLREEIRLLKYECRQKEIAAEQDRALRNKISDDCAALVKENAALASQTIELQKQLDAERHYQDNRETRRQANIQELVESKDNCNVLQREVDHLREQLTMERQKHREAINKLTKEERGLNRANLRGTKLQSELEELENMNSSQSEENVQLRRDKMILADHVAELQNKLSEAEEDLENLRKESNHYRTQSAQLESKVRLQKSMDTIKWEEFERMADSLKEFSRNISPMKDSRNFDYET
eukprot:gene10067-11095_t